ncbi:MAG: M28 family peptidase [Bacteroidales bacterium]|nr:M28 family peptidase [Bacteroidales bacterium]
MRKIFLSLTFILQVLLASAQAQIAYEDMVGTEELYETLQYLADDMAEGRATGSKGKLSAEQFIRERFRKYGLKPFEWNYTQSFRVQDTLTGRNVIGVVPANIMTDEYLVIGAHYDHLGILGGNTYNGADDNASGVTAMLDLARIFARMRSDGKGPAKNLIFVAYDCKELDLKGSDYFVRHLPFPSSKVICAINLDMLGTTLVPVHRNRPDYLIVLGEDTLPSQMQGVIRRSNAGTRFGMDIDYTFYGSKAFTDMIYRTGDHYSFRSKRIPSLLFTSAFHDHTYKPTDTVDIIDFEMLQKRTALIFDIIYRYTLL